MTVREVIKAIEADGWYRVRQTGSHRQFYHPIHRGCVIVAGHSRRDVPDWIVSSVMKRVGISRRKRHRIHG
ncbi:MAG: type II toxin-antitoxin system HicA family toxin [Acidimicrobiales bacterium]